LWMIIYVICIWWLIDIPHKPNARTRGQQGPNLHISWKQWRIAWPAILSPWMYIPSSDASELRMFMDIKLLFDCRTDESQLKDGIAFQIFGLETLAVLFGGHCFTAARFFMPCVCWCIALQATNIRRCQSVELLELASKTFHDTQFVVVAWGVERLGWQIVQSTCFRMKTGAAVWYLLWLLAFAQKV
jgi:hypothetical protein